MAGNRQWEAACGPPKPRSVSEDGFKSAKWDEIVSGGRFSAADVPALTLLVQWYAVVQRCIDDLDAQGGQVAYENRAGDLSPMPQISTMKQASAEIRQLNKQLGIADSHEGATDAGSHAATVLSLVTDRHEKRRAVSQG